MIQSQALSHLDRESSNNKNATISWKGKTRLLVTTGCYPIQFAHKMCEWVFTP